MDSGREKKLILDRTVKWCFPCLNYAKKIKDENKVFSL